MKLKQFTRAISEGNDDLVGLLDTFLAQGGSVHDEDEQGWSLLHHAIEHERPDLVRQLVARGVSIDAPDATGQTPLDMAAELEMDGVDGAPVGCAEFGMTKLVLELRSDLLSKDMHGRTPRQVLEHYAILELLRDYLLQTEDGRATLARLEQ